MTAVHACSGIDCETCISAERRAAEERTLTLSAKAKRFAARRRNVSAVTVAGNQRHPLDTNLSSNPILGAIDRLTQAAVTPSNPPRPRLALSQRTAVPP